MTTTGNIIKNLRDKFGFSQDAIAGYLGVKREMISYYENDSRPVPLEILEKLAALFGVDLEAFFSDDAAVVATETAFAFRAGTLNPQDLDAIAGFKTIVKNYLRIVKLGAGDAGE